MPVPDLQSFFKPLLDLTANIVGCIISSSSSVGVLIHETYLSE